MQPLIEHVDGQRQPDTAGQKQPYPVALVRRQQQERLLLPGVGFYKLGITEADAPQQLVLTHAEGFEHFQGDIDEIPIELFGESPYFGLRTLWKSRPEIVVDDFSSGSRYNKQYYSAYDTLECHLL
jgi:hypothetical protein